MSNNWCPNITATVLPPLDAIESSLMMSRRSHYIVLCSSYFKHFIIYRSSLSNIEPTIEWRLGYTGHIPSLLCLIWHKSFLVCSERALFIHRSLNLGIIHILCLGSRSFLHVWLMLRLGGLSFLIYLYIYVLDPVYLDRVVKIILLASKRSMIIELLIVVRSPS